CLKGGLTFKGSSIWALSGDTAVRMAQAGACGEAFPQRRNYGMAQARSTTLSTPYVYGERRLPCVD
ncbi:MAG: hypothetical protein KC588_19370, partial [Nitrospira sp.]|nr:hypothetical protein [Nitrospira sp.]